MGHISLNTCVHTLHFVQGGHCNLQNVSVNECVCVCVCVCAEIVAAEPLRSLEAEQVDFPGVGLLTEAYTPELRYCMLLGVVV